MTKPLKVPNNYETDFDRAIKKAGLVPEEGGDSNLLPTFPKSATGDQYSGVDITKYQGTVPNVSLPYKTDSENKQFLDKTYRQIKADNQGTVAKIFNSTIGGLTAGALGGLENIALIPQSFTDDFEKNPVAQVFADMKEWVNENTPIYSHTDIKGISDIDEMADVWQSWKSILDSAASFGIPGGAIVKGVGYASKLGRLLRPSRLGNVLNAGKMTNNFYTKSNAFLSKAMNSRAFQEAAKAGVAGTISNQLEGTVMAIELYDTVLKDLQSKGVDEAKAREIAAARANEMEEMNRTMLLSNMFQLHGLGKAMAGTRNIMTAPGIMNSIKSSLSFKKPSNNIFLQNLNEAAEEMYQSSIQQALETLAQEDAGLIDTGKSKYELMYDNFFSDQAMYEGMLGFFGGAMQRAIAGVASEFGNKGAAQQRYDAQQAHIKSTSDLMASNIKSFAKAEKLRQKAVQEGDADFEKLIGDMQFLNLAATSFELGTTGHLEGTLDDMINGENKEETAVGKQLKDKLLNLEKKYVEQFNQTPNAREAFMFSVTGDIMHEQLDIATKKKDEMVNQFRNKINNVAKNTKVVVESFGVIKEDTLDKHISIDENGQVNYSEFIRQNAPTSIQARETLEKTIELESKGLDTQLQSIKELNDHILQNQKNLEYSQSPERIKELQQLEKLQQLQKKLKEETTADNVKEAKKTTEEQLVDETGEPLTVPEGQMQEIEGILAEKDKERKQNIKQMTREMDENQPVQEGEAFIKNLDKKTQVVEEKGEAKVQNVKTTNWSNIISKAASPRELDTIIDQIDKEGTMSPDLMLEINKRREAVTVNQEKLKEIDKQLKEVQRLKEESKKVSTEKTTEVAEDISNIANAPKEMLSELAQAFSAFNKINRDEPGTIPAIELDGQLDSIKSRYGFTGEIPSIYTEQGDYKLVTKVGDNWHYVKNDGTPYTNPIPSKYLDQVTEEAPTTIDKPISEAKETTREKLPKDKKPQPTGGELQDFADKWEVINDIIHHGQDKIAYLAAPYEEVIRGRQLEMQDILDENGKIKLFPEYFHTLHPDNLLPGTPLVLRKVKDPKDVLIYHNGEQIKFSEWRNQNPDADMLDKYPIEILDNGVVVGYLHEPNWITDKRVTGKKIPIPEQQKRLRKMRRAVLKFGEVNTMVTDKSYGKLLTRDIDTLENNTPNSIVALYNGDVFTNQSDGSPIQDIEIIGKKQDWDAGTTYNLIRIQDNKYMATPVRHTKMSADLATTVVQAIKIFTKGEKNATTDLIEKELGYDITTLMGLSKYLQLYMPVKNLRGYELEMDTLVDDVYDFLNDSLYNTSIAGRPFIMVENGNIIFGREGTRKDTIRYVNSNTSNPDTFLKEFEEHLQDGFINLSQEGFGKVPVMIDKDGNATTPYKDYGAYAKGNIMTNIYSINIGDVDIYMTQPVVRFDESVFEGLDSISEEMVNLHNKIKDISIEVERKVLKEELKVQGNIDKILDAYNENLDRFTFRATPWSSQIGIFEGEELMRRGDFTSNSEVMVQLAKAEADLKKFGLLGYHEPITKLYSEYWARVTKLLLTDTGIEFLRNFSLGNIDSEWDNLVTPGIQGDEKGVYVQKIIYDEVSKEIDTDGEIRANTLGELTDKINEHYDQLLAEVNNMKSTKLSESEKERAKEKELMENETYAKLLNIVKSHPDKNTRETYKAEFEKDNFKSYIQSEMIEELEYDLGTVTTETARVSLEGRLKKAKELLNHIKRVENKYKGDVIQAQTEVVKELTEEQKKLLEELDSFEDDNEADFDDFDMSPTRTSELNNTLNDLDGGCKS